MSMGERLKYFRNNLGLSQKKVAEYLGITVGAYSHYENDSRELDVAKIKKLSQLFGISGDELIDTGFQKPLPKGLMPISQLQRKHIPLIGSVAAGEPIFDPDFPDVVVDGPLDADFALRVKGDSMEPEYLHGDLIYLRSTPDIPHEGATVAIAIDDEATLKRVYKHTDSVTLISNNPAYAPMVYSFVDHVIRVLGIPIGYTRMFRA